MRSRYQTQLPRPLLAHDELLSLATDGHREAFDELDVARDLVMRDLPVTEFANLVDCRLRAVTQLDPGHDLFAVLQIRHADHLHILDLGMGVQELFDLAWVDVLAAADD